MKKLLSLILLLSLLVIPVSSASADFEDLVTVSAGGYSFSFPEDMTSLMNVFFYSYLGPFSAYYGEPAFSTPFSITLLGSDFWEPSGIEESGASYREERLLTKISNPELIAGVDVEIIHRDDLSISRFYDTEGSYCCNAVVSESAPVFSAYATTPEYIELVDLIAETLTFSYFQIEPENLSSEELLAMREQIDQALANLENQE